jgi:hypothetical protein
MLCQITGHRQFSDDLPQKGLEVPCSLFFMGDEKEIQKVKRLTEHLIVNNMKSIKPPTKKQKTSSNVIEIMDDSCGTGLHKQSCEVWVKVNGYMLTTSDRKDLLDNNTKLNDRHINLAQFLLSRQFHNVDGLGWTLYQHKHQSRAYQMACKSFMTDNVTGL